ncbi:MAG: GldG family protein [Bacillota bacterium]
MKLSLFGQRRRLRRGAQVALVTAAVVGIVILANVLATRHHWRWDLTAQSRFTLSQQTRDVLGGLQNQVDITAFLVAGKETSDQIEVLLKGYEYATDKVKVKTVDPIKQPSLAYKYNIKNNGTILIESGSQQRRIEPYNLFGEGDNPYSPEFRGEQAVTRALMDLSRQSATAVYFLAGHGEKSLDGDLSRINDYLTGEGYTTRRLELPQEGKIPGDAALLVVAGPRKDLTPKEKELLFKYLDGGGKLLALMDPPGSLGIPAGWQELLDRLGVKMALAVTVDPQQGYFGDALTPVPFLAEHEITEKLVGQDLALVLPGAVPLSVEKGKQNGYQYSPLLNTSDKAWGETNLKENNVKKDGNDLVGPLTLAVAVEKTQPSQIVDGSSPNPDAAAVDNTAAAGRLAVVVGNSAFIGPGIVDMQGNADFFMNAAGWLVGRDSTITIRPKTSEATTVQLTRESARKIFFGTVIFLPLAVLLTGVFVWIRRRAR